MRYHFRHETFFRYHRPIRETVMEIRMHPLSDALQQCLSLTIALDPAATLFRYDDHVGNVVHHFDIPEEHRSLRITVDGEVEVTAPPALPDRLPLSAWDVIESDKGQHDLYEMLSYGGIARPSPEVTAYAASIGCGRHDDPLNTLRLINHALASDFQYAPDSTRVDSPVEEALRSRRGVCQDFAHLMVVLGRELGIPCRYVSGYLYSAAEGEPTPPQASHAWVEAWLPTLGWIGFDPTHDRAVNERYIRTAVGRDYGDVPPTRGVFKGDATCDLDVAVVVSPIPLRAELEVPAAWRSASRQAREVGVAAVHGEQ